MQLRTGAERRRIFTSLTSLLGAAVVIASCGGGEKTRPPASGGGGGQDQQGPQSGGGGEAVNGNGGSTNHGGGSSGTAGGGTKPENGSAGDNSWIDPTVPEEEPSDVPACDPCSDFPAEPVIDKGVPDNAASLFTQAPSGTLCVVEPADGSLFPKNWTRPRIKTQGADGQTYQITFHADRETNDLVVYTKSNPYYMSAEHWAALTKNVQDEPITVTIRASKGSGAPSEAKVTITVAPVAAGGAVVFWGSTTFVPGLTSSGLYGFHPGDDGVATTLQPGMVKDLILDENVTNLKRSLKKGGNESTDDVKEGQVRCVGCHASTPDGNAVAITDHWPWNVKIVSIDPATVGAQPDYVTPLGSLMAQLPWQGITTFSAGDGWPVDSAKPPATPRRRYISSFGRRTDEAMTFDPAQPWASEKFWRECVGGQCNKTNQDDLIWIDLAATLPDDAGTLPTLTRPATPTTTQPYQAPEITTPMLMARGTAWDIIAREGDKHGAVAPKWSHDGKTIAYTSTDATMDGRVGAATISDIYTVPFGDGKGGAAKPVAGASDTKAAEYYPDFSADDQWIAYNRVDNPGGKDLYYRQDGEIYVTSVTNGKAIRLAANDPPACTSEKSGTIFNSWPKWSPIVRKAKDKYYYFLVFSSARQTWGSIDIYGGAKEAASQLYMTAMTWDGTGEPKTYPAIYLWNQSYVVSKGADGSVEVANVKTNNVTPAWNEFVLPAVPPLPPAYVH